MSAVDYPIPELALTVVGQVMAAQAWLQENPSGIDLYMQTVSPFDYDPAAEANFVRVRIDVDFLTVLLRRQCFCCEHNRSDISTPSTLDSSDANSKSSIRRDLVIDKNDFWFQRNVSFPGVTSSQRISTGHLVRWLAGTPPGDTGQDQFRWVGGCLIYAENNLIAFADAILRSCPELAAKEIELQMAERIAHGAAKNASDAPVIPVTLVKRRRVVAV